MTVKDMIHRQIVHNRKRVDDWFKEQCRSLPFPFYASFDMRDAGFKMAPVDANIFPAGFNNICQVDKESASELVEQYLTRHYDNAKQIVLLTEEHTQNRFYWENVRTLQLLLQEAGREVKVAIPRLMEGPVDVESSSGHTVKVYPAVRHEQGVIVDGEIPELVICNNDFSDPHVEWVHDLDIAMNPPHELGWYRRKKSDFFKQYNQLAQQFARLIDIDPFLVSVNTLLFERFDVNDESSRKELGERVDQYLEELKENYLAHNIEHKPFVFIKNNAGTYGLGVIQAYSGDEVHNWNYKARKKMKAAKGGGGIQEVIIQEGIPTALATEQEAAEPVIYMIGSELAGGFLRTHEKKGPEDNLNSPGAVYKRLCVSDLKISIEGSPMENVYGWLAKIGMLAISCEGAAAKIKYKNYRG